MNELIEDELASVLPSGELPRAIEQREKGNMGCK